MSTLRISDAPLLPDVNGTEKIPTGGRGDFVDIVELKPYLHGRNFEVIEKTNNVTLLSKIASENIAVNIGTVTNNARLILKFK